MGGNPAGAGLAGTGVLDAAQPGAYGCIVALIGSVLWFGSRGRSGEELGFRWPSRRGTVPYLQAGLRRGRRRSRRLCSERASDTGKNPGDFGPKLNNLWPYVIWAVGQQFLLQSYFYARFEQPSSRGQACGSGRVRCCLRCYTC